MGVPTNRGGQLKAQLSYRNALRAHYSVTAGGTRTWTTEAHRNGMIISNWGFGGEQGLPTFLAAVEHSFGLADERGFDIGRITCEFGLGNKHPDAADLELAAEVERPLVLDDFSGEGVPTDHLDRVRLNSGVGDYFYIGSYERAGVVFKPEDARHPAFDFMVATAEERDAIDRDTMAGFMLDLLHKNM